MSVQTLYTAATGMDSLQTKLDVLANNLANVNTVGFKKARANFEDLFYRQVRLPGVDDQSGGGPTPTGIAVGLGSRVSSTQTDFQQGAFQTTGNQLDVAIEGDGFFQVSYDNNLYYTRAGNFSINANGQLVMGSANSGRLLEPQINIPPEATDISIGDTGVVQVRLPGTTTLQQVGQLQIARFLNPEGLLKRGDNLFEETDASGQLVLGNPGQDGAGLLRQSALEASNVEPVQELIDLITTQRAFELNSQTVQAGDQILQLIANLRRF
ncbi:MAG: flagellar basal-body rod protein FlgG [Planctomycetota bacterium]|nr:MAG: flagellar basal-body rod protein FlgG [Planctomycetota bacterium]REJ87087.1 MAG: flagellar basal-body rod protein FlgG [Planctomycetota bacterium]REK26995.1 MAG: flagellar basal-body rod protein FlgG [Planctomycetota bacterium]REK47278.1 MAG: flagellar basal-body rod protein FlgG [Planctomycetota bacterium]